MKQEYFLQLKIPQGKDIKQILATAREIVDTAPYLSEIMVTSAEGELLSLGPFLHARNETYVYHVMFPLTTYAEKTKMFDSKQLQHHLNNEMKKFGTACALHVFSVILQEGNVGFSNADSFDLEEYS